MLIPDFGKPVFGYLKPVLNRISILLTFIKMYYYKKKITVCVTRCNVYTLKAVSTPICSRFSLNEVMNIVYTVCFITNPLLIKTAYIKHLPNSNHSVLSHSIIMILGFKTENRISGFRLTSLMSISAFPSGQGFNCVSLVVFWPRAGGLFFFSFNLT